MRAKVPHSLVVPWPPLPSLGVCAHEQERQAAHCLCSSHELFYCALQIADMLFSNGFLWTL